MTNNRQTATACATVCRLTSGVTCNASNVYSTEINRQSVVWELVPSSWWCTPQLPPHSHQRNTSHSYSRDLQPVGPSPAAPRHQCAQRGIYCCTTASGCHPQLLFTHLPSLASIDNNSDLSTSHAGQSPAQQLSTQPLARATTPHGSYSTAMLDRQPEPPHWARPASHCGGPRSGEHHRGEAWPAVHSYRKSSSSS